MQSLIILNFGFALLFFDRGHPIAKEKEHGIGIKSMVYIVEKYQGVYQFTVKDGIFIFQAAM